MYGEERLHATPEQCGNCIPEEILDEIFRAPMDVSEDQLADDAAVVIIGRES